MSRIHLLTEEVCNRIAAGEVVERPSSVVKELMENSLDAGARKISVAVEKAGQKSIAVRDNGEGMDADDALLCLESHATSKIKKEEDIFAITSFGFRGEALPSIASVSRFQIRTRRKEAQEGTEVTVNGGTLLGTGGLVHAYSLAAKLAIENAGIVKYEDYTEMSVVCSYSDYQKINLEFEKNEVIIDNTDFTENVEVCFAVRSELADVLAKKISEISSGKSEPCKKGKRFDFYKN